RLSRRSPISMPIRRTGSAGCVCPASGQEAAKRDEFAPSHGLPIRNAPRHLAPACQADTISGAQATAVPAAGNENSSRHTGRAECLLTCRCLSRRSLPCPLALFLRCTETGISEKSRSKDRGTDDDDEILSTDLRRFLWGLCYQYDARYCS